MAKIEIRKTNTEKNATELRTDLHAAGVKMASIYIDGNLIGAMGYTTEKDLDAAKLALQSAIDGSKTVGDALDKLSKIAKLDDAGVSNVCEQVKINNTDVIIDYQKAQAVDLDGKTIADLKDMKCDLPVDAVRELLVARATIKICGRCRK